MKAFVTTLVFVLLFASRARAQKPAFGGFVEAGSGMTVGGGDGFSVMQRARTLARIGMALKVDEMPNDMFSVAVLADIEPTVALGVDGQWGHWLSRSFLVEAGPVAFIVPQTLFGLTGGFRYRLPLVGKVSLLAGVSVSGFFAGSDLPDNTAIVMAMGLLGIYADL